MRPLPSSHHGEDLTGHGKILSPGMLQVREYSLHLIESSFLLQRSGMLVVVLCSSGDWGILISLFHFQMLQVSRMLGRRSIYGGSRWSSLLRFGLSRRLRSQMPRLRGTHYSRTRWHRGNRQSCLHGQVQMFCPIRYELVKRCL